MNPKLAAAITTILWGFTYILTTEMLPHNPVLIAAVRALGGALFLLILSRQLLPAAWVGKILVLGTLNIGLFFGLFFIGAVRLPGGVAAIFQALGPLFVLLFVWMIIHIKPRTMQFISVILGVIGVGLVVLKSTAAIDWIGIMASLGCTVSLSLGSTLMNRWGKPPVDFASFTGWQLLIGGVELAIAALITNDIPSSVNMINITGFVILALFLTAIPFLLWFKAIATIGATQVVPFILLTPVTAFILDALIRQIMPSWLQILGVVLVLAALLLTSNAAKKQ